MGLFSSNSENHQEKLKEEFLYGSVANEIANNHVSPGLWAKAFSEADGNEQRAQAKYIKERVRFLRSEQNAVSEVIGEQKSNEISKQNRINEVATQVEPKPRVNPQGSDGTIGSIVILGAIGVLIYLVSSSSSNKGDSVNVSASATVPKVVYRQSSPTVAPPSPQEQYTTALREAMQKHPELNPNLPGHRDKLIERVGTRVAKYTKQGYSNAHALEVAIWDMETGNL